MKKSEESLFELWDVVKRNNLWIRAVPEEEESEKRLESLLIEAVENFPNLGSDLDIQLPTARRPPNKLKEMPSKTVLL